MPQVWIECPTCHLGFKSERLGVSLVDARQYTVVCSACRHPFDIDVLPRLLRAPAIQIVART